MTTSSETARRQRYFLFCLLEEIAQQRHAALIEDFEECLIPFALLFLTGEQIPDFEMRISPLSPLWPGLHEMLDEAYRREIIRWEGGQKGFYFETAARQRLDSLLTMNDKERGFTEYESSAVKRAVHAAGRPYRIGAKFPIAVANLGYDLSLTVSATM